MQILCSYNVYSIHHLFCVSISTSEAVLCVEREERMPLVLQAFVDKPKYRTNSNFWPNAGKVRAMPMLLKFIPRETYLHLNLAMYALVVGLCMRWKSSGFILRAGWKSIKKFVAIHSIVAETFCELHDVATGNVRGSAMSAGFILRGTCMFVQEFVEINPVVVEMY